MRFARTFRIAAAFLLIACGIGLSVWRRNSQPPPAIVERTATPAPSQRIAEASPAPEAQKSVELPLGQISELGVSSLPATLRLETGTLPWEAAIESVLAEQTPNSAKVEKLFGLLATQPPEAWERIGEEAIKRISNREYRAEAFPRVVNPQTTGQVEALLFADLMERPESIQLPSLLAITRMPGHPYAEPARENLVHALGADFKSDWAAWDQAIQRKIGAAN